jgi:AcrR family transcriptional regulator
MRSFNLKRHMPPDPLEAAIRASPSPLYRQLRPHPHGPGREEVEQNQRARLCGAAIEAIAVHGYEATSVAELSRLAGVSKRTFYEQFDNKQACFLATHDGITDCMVARVAVAQGDGCDREAALRSVFEVFVLAAADRPKAARLVLVASAGAGRAALDRTDRARRRFERLVVSGFGQAPVAVALPGTVATGIVCGVEHVVSLRLLGGRTGELPALAGPLADWALAHCSPTIAELPVPESAGPDRARNWPRLRARRDDERGRILRAAAEIAAVEGHVHIAPMRIVARAGVSERALDALYESPEECCLDALELAGLEVLTSAAAASRAAGGGARGVYRAIAALLDYVAEDPVLRGLIMLDALAEDAAVIACRERTLQRYVDLLASRLTPSQRLPGVVAEATVGALWGIVRCYVAAGAGHMLPALAGQAAYVALAPIVGAEAAVRTIDAEERSIQSGG